MRGPGLHAQITSRAPATPARDAQPAVRVFRKPQRMVQGSMLVPLKLERAEEEAALLNYSLRNTRGAVYLHCTGPAASNPPTTATLDYLTHCLEPSAHGMPRVGIFPLLPFLSWSVERITQQLPDVEEVVAAAEHAGECHALVDRLNEVRHMKGLPSISLTITAGHLAHDAAATEQQPQQRHQQHKSANRGGSEYDQQEQQQQDGGEGAATTGPCARVIGVQNSPELQFRKVAVGGTFDRLHAGHRLLLATTALVAREQIFVGITADQLLASKKNQELLESYEEREAAAVGYMQLVNPKATVVAGPLTDPKEPPLCAMDPEFDAIVVSEETVPGAHAINQVRAEQGFPLLTIVVIGLIYSRRHNAKLSSTDLREEDAEGTGGSGSGSPPRR